ncbi:serine/threonine-protein kinase [Actinomycetes bacterium KLBMP 9797]
MEGERVLGDRYRLHERIGEGGTAVVWRATDEVLRRPVAVKVLSGRVRNDAAARLRIQAEARAAAKLAHPCVASVFDYGESPGADGQPVPFVVMELLEGPSLSRRLNSGPLPPAEALRVCAEVARGLAAAHDAGLVHRDVKPANVMLTPGGAKVVDFGIAAAAGPLDGLDPDGSMLGTPAYLAPERLVGGDVLAASDVYALGLLLHATLVGRLPWEAETTTQMLAAHVYVEPSPLPRIAGVPARVAEVYQHCLAKNPADRPSAQAVAEALADLLAAPGGAAGTPAAAPVPVRRRAVFALAGAGAVVIATALALLLDTGRPGEGTKAGAEASATSTPSPRPDTLTASPVKAAGGQRPESSTTARGQRAPGGVPSTGASRPASVSPTSPVAPPPPAPPSPTPLTAREQRTFSTVGGSMVVRCSGALAEVVQWTPASGYQVKGLVPGPAKRVKINFKGATTEKVRVRCPNGIPTRVNEE